MFIKIWQPITLYIDRMDWRAGHLTTTEGTGGGGICQQKLLAGPGIWTIFSNARGMPGGGGLPVGDARGWNWLTHYHYHYHYHYFTIYIVWKMTPLIACRMIIISATFITIIFPQICDKHQTFLTLICFFYLTSLIAHQSYALVIFYCRVYVPHLCFLRVRCPNNAEIARFLRLTHLGTIAQPFFKF